MREYKFRAFILNPSLESNNIVRHSEEFACLCDFFTLMGNHEIDIMEWTGLKDSTGEDIYEGDLVTGDYVWGGHAFLNKEVVFKFGSFLVHIIDDRLLNLSDLDVKVTGNKYEVNLPS